jgi:hypothetical protein
MMESLHHSLSNGDRDVSLELPRPLKAHIFPRAADEFYVEPEWCSERLFQEEPFEGAIYDPCCGIGRIVVSALKAGYRAYGSDLVHRGWDSTPQDFLQHRDCHDNIVCNPPFDIAQGIAERALALARHKVAIILPTARLNAAHWLKGTPLQTIWLLTPRPSMPPGRVILGGGKPGGGKADFCWLVLAKGHSGEPAMRWLHRDVVP